MLISSIPAKFTIPWANSASATYTRAIPTPSQIGITAGAASFADGFPPLCFQAGGWPDGRDFNGILNQITQWAQWQSAGGPIAYDATFQTAIGGYPLGATIRSGTTFGFLWTSTVDGNTTNPDAGGAGWISGGGAGRLLNIQVFPTAGTFTYTPTPGTSKIEVEVHGGGAAGGGAVAPYSTVVSIGAPGGAGAYARKLIKSGFSGVTITVGAGGVGAANVVGANGGTSSFGSLVTSPGGVGGGIYGGIAPPATYGGAQSGIATGGDINAAGAPGGVTLATALNFGCGAEGGASYFGGGGGAVPANANGASANAPGAGGSGVCALASTTALAGGSGMAGLVIIHEYA